MSEIAIRVEGLGKRYHIGALKARQHRTLGQVLAGAAAGPLRRAARLVRGNAEGAADLDETIWAVRDVSLEVRRGEVVGVIGANGAGKSTLLKILSRITEPTEGFAEVHGRVGALLEVGTGFHRELTGRENVYLNGAILGMRRVEIDRKFDEIVAFSEVEKFIDTPVKHYSTGMSVRLAFAVAAHLDPEILVVDEVLSVGDAAFQRKCLGKMGDVAHSGRTVLFVSHNMGAVTQLCERVVLLDHGRVRLNGEPAEVVASYLSSGTTNAGSWRRPERPAEDAPEAFLESARILSGDGRPVDIVPFSEPFQLELAYRVDRPIRDLTLTVGVEDPIGTLLFTSYDTDTTQWGGRKRPAGAYVSLCKLPAGLLRPGRYNLNVCFHVPKVRFIDVHERILAVEISHVGFLPHPNRPGTLAPVLEWTVTRDGRAPIA